MCKLTALFTILSLWPLEKKIFFSFSYVVIAVMVILLSVGQILGLCSMNPQSKRNVPLDVREHCGRCWINLRQLLCEIVEVFVLASQILTLIFQTGHLFV